MKTDREQMSAEMKAGQEWMAVTMYTNCKKMATAINTV
jgi:hypothetical protein